MSDDGRLAQALASDRAQLRGKLRELVTQPVLREALFVASPSLDESLLIWIEAPESERGQKVERTVVRYFTRLTARPTPFGLFAGCSVGSVEDSTQLVLSSQDAYLRHTRLDMDYLTSVIEALNRDAKIRESFRYRPNSSLYSAAQRLRYVESRLEENNRSYHLSAVEPTDYLALVLDRASSGAPLSDLGRVLRESDRELQDEEIQEYLKALVDNQVLVSELALSVTGVEPIHDLIAQLQDKPDANDIVKVLEKTRERLDALDRRVGNPTQEYREIAAALEALPAKVELPRLFQVDLHKPSPQAVLGGPVMDQLVQAVGLLHRLTPKRGAQRQLQEFRDAFTRRYETREMPLVEVLDEEAGIGFQASTAPSAEASPLLAGLLFPNTREEQGSFAARDLFLLNRLEESLRSGDPELQLSDADLKKIETKDPYPLPDAFAVIGAVLAPSGDAVGRGQFRVLIAGADGPSGAKLLGRFCYGDPQLAERVGRHLRQEESSRPDAIFAEIVHLPEGRIGNVLLRPALREYEIPYLGRAGVSVERQIPVTDLLVSVIGERIRLRSSKLGCEIIPRLTNAHNFGLRSLGMYRFLCSLQQQAVASGLSWSWGALEGASFLPRVLTGRIVLCRARWNLSEASLKELGAAQGAEQFKAIQRLRERLKLPRLVLVADADNTLLVDLDNVLSIETFIQLVKGRQQVRLEEFYADELCAQGPEGRYTHELVIPFVRVARPSPVHKPPPQAVLPPSRRSFAPGSEWTYAKLYTGTASADQVLKELVVPLIRRATNGKWIDRWFFIRYGDPDWHLRLRCRGLPERLRTELIPSLESAVDALLADGRVWRFQFDTYEREVERYGGPEGIELAEKLFQVDSEAVVRILELLSGDEGADARWRLALRGMDMLLDDLGLTPDAKLGVVKPMRESYGREFRVDGSFERQLGAKYREERRELENVLGAAQADHGDLAPGLAILKERSLQIAPIASTLKQLEVEGRLTVPIATLASSYLHMHANRFLRSAARAHELVLYDFLTRTYESRLARIRKASNPKGVA
jgi:thiopeptide-type bacteriocin biosynthesis protein